MNIIKVKKLDTLTAEKTIEILHETRLLVIENSNEVPENELVDFYYKLGDPVVFDDEYMSEEYVHTYSKGHRELVPVRNREISGYGEPGLFSGDDDGEVKWHLESQNRDTHDDVVAFAMKNLSSTGGDTWFMDQQDAYNNLPTSIKEMIRDVEIDWSNRYSKESPSEEFKNIRYNPWQEWDKKCVKGGDGWMYVKMKDIDGKYLVDKEVKYKPLVPKNTISGKLGLAYPLETIYKFKDIDFDESEKIMKILNDEVTKEKYIYRHVWKKGDILINDIQHSLHRRDKYTGDRLIYRTSIYFKNNPKDPRKIKHE